MAKPIKSDALKGVFISSIEEVVDAAMEHLPAIDLANEANRIKVRNWMVRICQVVTQNNAQSFARATESAIEEAAALAINPEYHATRKANRAKRKAQAALIQMATHPKKKAEIEFDRLTSAEVKM